MFVPGEFVFFRISPTIGEPLKREPRLRPGVFYDYVMKTGLKFSEQHIVIDLEGFAKKLSHM